MSCEPEAVVVCGAARRPSFQRVRVSRRIRQMSSHRTFGGLPALPEPGRTRNDARRTHDPVDPWSLRGHPKGP